MKLSWTTAKPRPQGLKYIKVYLFVVVLKIHPSSRRHACQFLIPRKVSRCTYWGSPTNGIVGNIFHSWIRHCKSCTKIHGQIGKCLQVLDPRYSVQPKHKNNYTKRSYNYKVDKPENADNTTLKVWKRDNLWRNYHPWAITRYSNSELLWSSFFATEGIVTLPPSSQRLLLKSYHPMYCLEACTALPLLWDLTQRHFPEDIQCTAQVAENEIRPRWLEVCHRHWCGHRSNPCKRRKDNG